MAKSYVKKVIDLLEERAINMGKYKLLRAINQEAEFKGRMYIFEHIDHSEYTIEVTVDFLNGKIAYYQINI